MKKTLILFLFAICAGRMVAQDYKCGPEICTRQAAGEYIIEFAGCSSFLEVYVLSKAGKALRNVLISGKAEFNYIDETVLTADFKQYFLTNSLRAKVPSPGFYSCRVFLVIEGQTVSATFINEYDLRAGVHQ